MSLRKTGRLVKSIKYLSWQFHVCNSVKVRHQSLLQMMIARSVMKVMASSLLSATPRGFNSAIIINDHPFAYPNYTFGVGIRTSAVIESWQLQTQLFLLRFYLLERIYYILLFLPFGLPPDTEKHACVPSGSLFICHHRPNHTRTHNMIMIIFCTHDCCSTCGTPIHGSTTLYK